MMKKIIMLLVLVVLIYFSIYLIQNQTLKNSFEEYNNEEISLDTNSDLIRCNLNIFKPEFAYTFFHDKKGHISFKETNVFSQTSEEWQKTYTGGTTVKNTTFSNLVLMVKDDCYQFQKDYDNPKVNEGGIDWGYREYDREAEEQKELQEKMEYERLGMKKYKSTPENLKKVEEKLREQEGVTENQIQEVMNDFRSQEYFEIGGVDL